jgi:hypothetical protein
MVGATAPLEMDDDRDWIGARVAAHRRGRVARGRKLVPAIYQNGNANQAAFGQRFSFAPVDRRSDSVRRKLSQCLGNDAMRRQNRPAASAGKARLTEQRALPVFSRLLFNQTHSGRLSRRNRRGGRRRGRRRVWGISRRSRPFGQDRCRRFLNG